MSPELRESAMNVAAWQGCVAWAVTNAEIVARFTAETGRPLSAPKNGLEAMIDKACGIDLEANMRAFVGWASRNIWGEAESPAVAWEIEKGIVKP